MSAWLRPLWAHRCATGENWQAIMLDCVSHRACEEAVDEKGGEPHVHAAPVHEAPPGLASASSPIAVPHGAGFGSGSSGSASAASAFLVPGPGSGLGPGLGSASGPVLNLRTSGVSRVVGAGSYKSGVHRNETGTGPEHTCGSDVAYAYFVSFIFLCSFLVRLPAATHSPLCALDCFAR